MDDGREVASAQPAGESGKATRDLRQEITDRMVAALGEGRIPWEKPWQSLDHGLPRNVASGREYRGGNRLILMLEQMDRGYADSRFGTMKQINELGGRVKKGERGIPVELWKEQPFWERRDVTVTAAYGHRVKVFGEERGAVLAGAYSDKEPTLRLNPDDLRVVHHPSGRPEQSMSWKDAHGLDVMVGRVFTVFNVEQTDGMKIEPLAKAEQRFDVAWRGEAIKAAMERDGLQFGEHPKFAFYSPKRDAVSVPPRGQFPDEKGYYGTLLHEIGHATGAEKRLNREGITGNHRFGSEGYAKEELRAELFSVFMAAQTGIAHDETQHKAYIQSWAEALKKDKNEIFRAAAEAGKAVDYVLDKERAIELERNAEKARGADGPAPVNAPAASRVVSAVFVHKPGDGERLLERLPDGKKPEQAKIIESRNLSTAEYDAFAGDLFADHDWLQGKGGIEPLPQGGQQRHVIELMAEDRQTLLVDPSGHGYARIVGIPEADIARVLESKSLAAPDKPGKLRAVEIDAPAHWASALVNRDESGLGSSELDCVRDWIEKHGLGWPVSASETFMGRHEGLLTEMATYTFLVPEKGIGLDVPESKSLAAPADPGKRLGAIGEKKAIDLKPGDRIVERIRGHAGFVDTVYDVRFVQDGKVHVDLNNDTATRIYDESAKVFVMRNANERAHRDPAIDSPTPRAVEESSEPGGGDKPEPPERQAPPRRRKSRGMER